jgi:hypothetical protein
MMKITPKAVYFTLVFTGIFLTVSTWIFLPHGFPERAKIPMIWMILSMGLFWAADRIFHAIFGIPGETKRDGVIWFIPLSLGWIPMIIFATELVSIKYYLGVSISTYCFASYIVVTGSRPKITDDFDPCYREKSGLASAKNLFGLFKYEMDVSVSNGSIIKQSIPFRAPSLSYLFYTFCFGFTAFAISTKEISTDPRYIPVCLAALLACTICLCNLTINATEEKMLWRIQDKNKEGILLCFVYAVATINIVVFMIANLLI